MKLKIFLYFYKFSRLYRIKYFTITDRQLGYESDNQIHYYAGPVKIKTYGTDQTITLSTSYMWKHMLPECLEIAKYAWEVEDEDVISITETEIVIRYNLKIINLYLENSIIFS